MLENGRIEIETRDELLNFPLKSVISYITKDGLYRSGGFFKNQFKINILHYKVVVMNILLVFPVQFKNVEKMYVKNFDQVEEVEESSDEDPKKKKKKKKEKKVKREDTKTYIIHTFC
jgi:hypothetical protein